MRSADDVKDCRKHFGGKDIKATRRNTTREMTCGLGLAKLKPWIRSVAKGDFQDRKRRGPEVSPAGFFSQDMASGCAGRI